MLYTEPDTTWRIQGEAECRDCVYGKGLLPRQNETERQSYLTERERGH
ncbi:MAG: hypothetical protein WCP20_00335 [Desulfuromonadales bacterium]